MSTVLQADEKGNLLLPPSLLPESEPLGSYRIEESAGKLIIAKEPPQEKGSEPLWKLPREERVKAFRNWVASFPPGPGLSDYAVSRDSMYD
jgi:hypothetical protein